MISAHCFTREWIESQRSSLAAVDPAILERAIFALGLLHALRRTSLDFVFKGGTSLLLHLPTPLRLSIDIDIVCATDRDSLRPVLEGLLVDTPFIRWEEHVRGESRLPKRLHFKLYYDSPLRPGYESHILLDVVTEQNVITDLVEKSVEVCFIESKTKVIVKTPSVNALLGDKLTAFAPQTIGVPLSDRFSQQVIKQLFDIGQLYDVATDLVAVGEANRQSYDAESSYRGTTTELTYEAYLDDTIQTCQSLCAIDLRGFTETESTGLLRRGINQLTNHLIGTRFGLLEAKIAAGKTAVLAALIKRNQLGRPMPKFSDPHLTGLKEHRLPEKYQNLERLKLSSPQSYYYWSKLDE